MDAIGQPPPQPYLVDGRDVRLRRRAVSALALVAVAPVAGIRAMSPPPLRGDATLTPASRRTLRPGPDERSGVTRHRWGRHAEGGPAVDEHRRAAGRPRRRGVARRHPDGRLQRHHGRLSHPRRAAVPGGDGRRDVGRRGGARPSAALGVGADDLATIVVTHIHLDHAGGVGDLAAAFPRAEVVVHEAGARHLADPSRLMASAARVFGPVLDELFGRAAAHRRRTHPRAQRRRRRRPRRRAAARLVRLPRPRPPPRRTARLAHGRPLHRRRRRGVDAGDRRPAAGHAAARVRPRRRSRLARADARTCARSACCSATSVRSGDVGTTLDRSVEELRLWVELVPRREATASISTTPWPGYANGPPSAMPCGPFPSWTRRSRCSPAPRPTSPASGAGSMLSRRLEPVPGSA